MFPEQMLRSPKALFPGSNPNDRPNLRNQAVLMYVNTLIDGRVSRAIGRLRRQPVNLQDLNQILRCREPGGQRFAGVQAVRIDRIQGTEGRVKDFDRSFRPIHDGTRSRWLSVAAARLGGQELPAVELIQVGETYFVRDGHHRVSVAKALGEKFIDAEIVQWEIAG